MYDELSGVEIRVLDEFVGCKIEIWNLLIVFLRLLLKNNLILEENGAFLY